MSKTMERDQPKYPYHSERDAEIERLKDNLKLICDFYGESLRAIDEQKTIRQEIVNRANLLEKELDYTRTTNDTLRARVEEDERIHQNNADAYNRCAEERDELREKLSEALTHKNGFQLRAYTDQQHNEELKKQLAAANEKLATLETIGESKCQDI